MSITEIYSNKYGSCPKLTGDNYEQWSIDISFLLDAERAWKIVLGEEIAPSAPASSTAAEMQAYESDLENFTLRKTRAAVIIYESLSNPMQAYINNERNPTKMWEILETHFDTTESRLLPARLIQEFYQRKFPTRGSINTYIATLLDYQNRLDRSVFKIDDRLLLFHLLTSLPPTYHTIVHIIINQPAEVKTKEYIFKTLRDHDLWIAQRTDTSSNSDLAGKGKYHDHDQGSGWQENGGRDGGGRKSGFHSQNQRFEPYAKTNPICWYCMKRGHKQKDCHMKQKAEKLREKGDARRNRKPAICL